MTERHDERDPTVGALSALTTHEPDPVRAARVLACGRARLAGRKHAPAARVARLDRRGVWRAAVEPLLVAGACAVFLFEVLARATRLYGF